MEKGVIYVCDNSNSHKGELLYSIKSLKRTNPDLKTALFASKPSANLKKWFDHVYPIDPSLHPLKNKVRAIGDSPFRYTLYLDVDTEICGDLETLFSFLQEFEFCIANEPKINYQKRPPEFLGYTRENEYNTGLVLYRKNKNTIYFLRQWAKEILKVPNDHLKVGEFGDQLIFNQLLKKNGNELLYSILDNKIYNTRFRSYLHMADDLRRKVIIKHWHFMNRSKLFIKIDEYYIFLLNRLFKIKKEQIM